MSSNADSPTNGKGWIYATTTMAIILAVMFGAYAAHLFCEYKERPIIVQPEPKPEPKPPWWKR